MLMMGSFIVQNVSSRFWLWSQGIDRVFCPKSEKQKSGSFFARLRLQICTAKNSCIVEKKHKGTLTHCGRVTQILSLYITTVQDGWRKSAFLTRAWFPRTIHLITQYMEHFSDWSCWRMFIRGLEL